MTNVAVSQKLKETTGDNQNSVSPAEMFDDYVRQVEEYENTHDISDEVRKLAQVREEVAMAVKDSNVRQDIANRKNWRRNQVKPKVYTPVSGDRVLLINGQ